MLREDKRYDLWTKQQPELWFPHRFLMISNSLGCNADPWWSAARRHVRLYQSFSTDPPPNPFIIIYSFLHMGEIVVYTYTTHIRLMLLSYIWILVSNIWFNNFSLSTETKKKQTPKMQQAIYFLLSFTVCLTFCSEQVTTCSYCMIYCYCIIFSSLLLLSLLALKWQDKRKRILGQMI